MLTDSEPMRSQKGFTVVEIVIVVVAVVAIGLVLFKVLTRNVKRGNPTTNQGTQQSSASTPSTLIWQQTKDGWQSTSTPPSCPAQPMLKLPADLAKVTAILYPGQTRGGNYKPHGGFRFDHSANSDIKVTAPIDGYLMRGAQYLADGEVQYTFDVMNNCGVMFRVGHLRQIPDNLLQLTKSWPAPVENGSQTNNINPPVHIKTGDLLATEVGIIKEKNTFFDFGVYDYRQNNSASNDPAYQAAHGQFPELAYHAVCWFDWFPSTDAATIKALPAGDPTSGKTSDYCKQ